MKTTKNKLNELSALLAILHKNKQHTAQQLFETLATRYAVVKRSASSK